MNYLQKLIELRQLTCQDIATGIGYGYHSVQKTVKGIRRQPTIRIAIADYLGLDPIKTWGRGSIIYLRRQVAVEANRVAQKRADAARTKFLSKYQPDAHNLTAKRSIVNV